MIAMATQRLRAGAPMGRVVTIIAALFALIATAAAALAQAGPAANQPPSLLVPRIHQFDLELNNVSSFVDDSSLIRRREASITGSALHFGPDLGEDTLQMPEVNATFWLDGLNAVQFQWRSFLLYGSKFLPERVNFNGDVIAPGQDLNTDGTTWFTIGFFYERRISPWLRQYEGGLPEWLQRWDLRPRIGLEFTYLDFMLNNAHPRLISGDLEAHGRWQNQESPVPAIGLEARRDIGHDLSVEVTAQGTWINKWDSFRSQSGTIYLSQSEFENHWRLIYEGYVLAGFRPFLGFTYYYYKQAETSAEIGNLVRLQTYGPEVGIGYSFGL
jgi:hypothetical protein